MARSGNPKQARNPKPAQPKKPKTPSPESIELDLEKARTWEEIHVVCTEGHSKQHLKKITKLSKAEIKMMKRIQSAAAAPDGFRRCIRKMIDEQYPDLFEFNNDGSHCREIHNETLQDVSHLVDIMAAMFTA
jgi:hypothetical protein